MEIHAERRKFMAVLTKTPRNLLLSSAIMLLTFTLAPVTANAQHGKGSAFCKQVYNPDLNPTGHIFVSQGAQMFCFGPQFHFGAALGQLSERQLSASASSIGNVDAANPAEDIAPNGTVAYGQSETSVAATDQYVVEAWNDSTAFFAPCPSPDSKEEATGFAFSNDGGNSFTDLGGLPNIGCGISRYEGDPSVEAWETQGQHYFYISSLFANLTNFSLEVAVTACQVVGFNASATLECGQPTVVATSPTGFFRFSGLDKDFAAIDPRRGRLYISYADFAAGDSISLAACDLNNNPMQPVCSNGATNGPTYLVVAQPDPNFCENNGAYPAVDVNTGDVYVAYEHNWPSAFGFGPCATEPTKEVITRIPNFCLTFPGPSPCSGPFPTAAEFVTSLSAAFIPGYNRFPMNDFSRIAYSPVYQTVSIVWNDGRFKPTGDILLQSWWGGWAFPAPVQGEPVVLDDAKTAGVGWQILPAMRNTDDNGNLFVSWYSRATPGTTLTDVYEAVGISPLVQSTPANLKITDVASDWIAVSSDIAPNFGDYTDNYVRAVGGYGPPFPDQLDFVAWSDGRLGVPQPFEAHLPTH
jgi:hypothetical protein